MTAPSLVFLIAVFVVVVLAAETRGVRWVVWVAKPLASSGFLALALSHDALATPYGKTVFIALCLSWLGDVFLIAKTKKAFLAGLVSFLFGHVAFAVAFVVHGVSLGWVAASSPVLIIIAVVVGRWVFPHLERSMRAPVLAYIIVITGMVALAAGAIGLGGDALILISAVMFFVSDIAVAKEAFVSPSPANRIWGLPLYYAAQIGFAFTVAG